MINFVGNLRASVVFGVLGAGFIGYLAYRAIRRWVADRCQTTKKVDKLAGESIKEGKSPPPSYKKPLVLADTLAIGEGQIKMGQGEYIVFHRFEDGSTKAASFEQFDPIYEILINHSPASLIKNGKSLEECQNRHELIRSELKKIDETLEAIFIPKTLYELFFVKKCIKEDQKNNKICEWIEPSRHSFGERIEDKSELLEIEKENEARRAQKKCWHVRCIKDTGNDQDSEIKKVVFRLNKALFKAFEPSSEGFTFEQLSSMTEGVTDDLKAYHEECMGKYKTWKNGEIGVSLLANTCTPGPTTNFGYDSSEGSIAFMGIKDERDAEIIKNAVALECSEIAKHSLFLYRGSQFEKDATHYHYDKKVFPYSLSYGSGLFAGCVYDGGATAFYFMCQKKNNAYTIPVSYDALNLSPFFVPDMHTVNGLLGFGDRVQSRTKLWKGIEEKNLMGLRNFNGPACQVKKDLIRSDLTQEEFIKEFSDYKSQAIQLKSKDL